MRWRSRWTRDVGASAAVFLDGEPVVDIWGGYADAARASVGRDTIVNVWSVSKTMLRCARWSWPTAATWTWTRRSRGTGPSSPPRASRACWCGTCWPTPPGLPDWDGRSDEDLYDWPGPPPGWPRRPRAGRRAPRPAITRSPRDSWSARSSAGSPAGSPGDFFARRWPGRWTPTSTSARPPSTTTGSPRSSRRRGRSHAPAAARAPPARQPPSGRDGNTRPGGGRRSRPRAATATPARSAAVQSVLACGGTVRGRPAAVAGRCERAREEQYRAADQILGRTMRYGMGYGLLAAPASGAAGAARWSWSTPTTA